MSGISRRWTAGLVLAALAAGVAPVYADELEYRAKAAFIERFTGFVDWPAGALGAADRPFILCVIGDSPLTTYVERIARERRRIKERRADIRHIKAPPEAAACHVLVIGGSERLRLRPILDAVSGRGVLTVGDAEGFAHKGVLINLVADEEGRVRFEICARELKRSGLTMSAQLLRLARLVNEGAP